MVRPRLPASYVKSKGWYPTYMIPASRFKDINPSGHPGGKAVEAKLVPCPSGGQIKVKNGSKADKNRGRKRFGCNGTLCQAQKTHLCTVKCRNPDTDEDSLIVEISHDLSYHQTADGMQAFEFINGLEEFLLADVAQAPRNNNEDAQSDQVPRNQNEEANGDPPGLEQRREIEDSPSSAFRRLFAALAGTTESSTAIVPFTNNSASIARWLEDAMLKTDEDLLQLAQGYFNPQNAHMPVRAYDLQGELGRLMPSISSGLCHTLTAAMVDMLCQDQALKMLATLDNEQKYLERVESEVSASTYNDAKVRIYNKAIKKATSDRIITRLLLRLAKLLLKYKAKSKHVSSEVWKPNTIQSEILIKAIAGLIQQALDLCDSMAVERFTRNIAELQRQERDGLIDWKPLEAETKFLAGKVKLLQGEFECAASFFKEAADAVELANADAVQIDASTHFSSFSQEIDTHHDRAKHLSTVKKECDNLNTDVLVSLSSQKNSPISHILMSKLDACSKVALASTDLITRKCLLMACDGSWDRVSALLCLVSTASKNCTRALGVVLNGDPFPGASQGPDDKEVKVIFYLPPGLCHWYIRALRFLCKFSQGKQCVEILESLRQEHGLVGLDWLSSEKEILVDTEDVCAVAKARFELIRNTPVDASNIAGGIIQDLKRCLEQNNDFSNSRLHVNLIFWLAQCYAFWAEDDYSNTKHLKLEAAAEYYATVLKMRPQNVDIWLKLAKLYTEMAKSLQYLTGRENDVKEYYGKALDNCLSALKINDKCMDALLCRADIFFDMDLPESALTDYDRWMQLYGNSKPSNTSPDSDPVYQHVRYRRFMAQGKLASKRRESAANATPRVPRGQAHRRSISQLSPRTYTSLNAYQRLGLDNTASIEDVKKAYRRFAVLFHPDKNGDEEMFKLLGDAYEKLLANFDD